MREETEVETTTVELITHDTPLPLLCVQPDGSQVQIPVTPWDQAGPHLAAAPDLVRDPDTRQPVQSRQWRVVHLPTGASISTYPLCRGCARRAAVGLAGLPIDWSDWTETTGNARVAALPDPLRRELYGWALELCLGKPCPGPDERPS